jgi:hypothetical protein
MAAAVHVRNRVHNSGAGGLPFSLATGRRADLSSMRVSGCLAYVHVDKSQRRKLDDGRVSLWAMLPNHLRGWCLILLLGGW